MTMKTVIAACVLILASTRTVHAQQGPLCPGLKGQARTSCLQGEVKKANADVAAANAKLARLDNAMKISCDLVAALDKAAKGAALVGGIAQNHPLTVAGVTWTSAREFSSNQAKERTNCDAARAAAAEARRK